MNKQVHERVFTNDISSILDSDEKQLNSAVLE